jgi:hypothetical protein
MIARIAVLLGFLAVPLAAQASALAPDTVLPVGTVVRVRQAEFRPEWQRGRLLLADSAHLVLDQGGGQTLDLPQPAVRDVKVQGPLRRHGAVRRGALRGFAVGAGIVAVSFFAIDAGGERCHGCELAFIGWMIGAVPVTVATTVVGGLHGQAHPPHGWDAVPLPVRTAPADTAASATPP